MTLPYGTGESAEVFKYSLFLVACNRLVAATIAAATLIVSCTCLAKAIQLAALHPASLVSPSTHVQSCTPPPNPRLTLAVCSHCMVSAFCAHHTDPCNPCPCFAQPLLFCHP